MKEVPRRPDIIWTDAAERMPNADEINIAPNGTFLCHVLIPDGKGRGRFAYRVCITEYEYGETRHFVCSDGIVMHWAMIPRDPRN